VILNHLSLDAFSNQYGISGVYSFPHFLHFESFLENATLPQKGQVVRSGVLSWVGSFTFFLLLVFSNHIWHICHGHQAYHELDHISYKSNLYQSWDLPMFAPAYSCFAVFAIPVWGLVSGHLPNIPFKQIVKIPVPRNARIIPSRGVIFYPPYYKQS